MNQKQLSEAARISQATISRVEQGKIHELKSSALARLAAALDVPVDSLINEIHQPYEVPNDFGNILGECDIALSHSAVSDPTSDSERINALLRQAVKDIIMRRSFQRKLYELFRDEIEASLKEQQ